MRSFIIKPGDLIPIGRAGENQATEIRFDVTGWAETFGAGQYALVMKRPGESELPYPVEVTTDGDFVVWAVSNVDTGIAGNAQVQLRYTVDGALAKSVIYRGIVGESLDNIVDPPDPYEDLIGQMVDLTERAEAAAESASGSAGTATTAAEAAQTAKTAAETAAGQAQSAKESAQASATTATQAKEAAQTAQTAAETAQSAAAQSAIASSGSATAAAGSATEAAASATAADASADAAAASAATLTLDASLTSATQAAQAKAAGDAITEINNAIQRTVVCIDATDTGSYETAPSTRSFAHPYPFVAGKKYHAVLTVNQATFLIVSDAIRVQQSGSTGTSTTSLLGYVFRISNGSSQIVAGSVYEADFVAAEGCKNLLARYKFDAGDQDIDFDVTIKEYVTDDIELIKEDVQNKYADCTIKSRMLMGAHRGAEKYAPPNSVVAYELAGKMGFPWAWLAQIRWSADNTLYVMHDEDVSITTNGTGNISTLSDSYIDSLLVNKISGYDYSQFTDDDLRVPTLEKAIQICLRYGMKMCFRIEPFPNQIETERQQQIWDNFETLIKAYGISADWCCYSGYNAAEMARCITLFGEDAEICPFLGSSISSAQDVVDWFNAIQSVTIKNKSVLLGANSLTLNDVKLLHTNGIKVYAFTNSTSPTQELMEQLAYWGVDILQNPRYARIPNV